MYEPGVTRSFSLPLSLLVQRGGSLPTTTWLWLNKVPGWLATLQWFLQLRILLDIFIECPSSPFPSSLVLKIVH